VDGILGTHTLMKAKALEAAAGRFVAAGDRTRARVAFTAAVEVYTSLGVAADVSRLQAAFRPGHPPLKASWRVLGLPWLHPHKALSHPRRDDEQPATACIYGQLAASGRT
jgi:hypothetical protein